MLNFEQHHYPRLIQDLINLRASMMLVLKVLEL